MATRKPKAKRSHLREWPKPRPKSPRPAPNALPVRTRGGSEGGQAAKGGEGGHGPQGPMERAREWLQLDDPLGRPVQVTFSATVLNAALLALAVLMAVVMSSCVRFIK